MIWCIVKFFFSKRCIVNLSSLPKNNWDLNRVKVSKLNFNYIKLHLSCYDLTAKIMSQFFIFH